MGDGTLADGIADESERGKGTKESHGCSVAPCIAMSL